MSRNKVMIIDDDAEVLTLMSQQLEVIYDVIKCNSGEDALNTVKF